MNDDSFVSPKLLLSERTNATDMASDLSLCCVSDIFKLNANLPLPQKIASTVSNHIDNNPFLFGDSRIPDDGV
jgi:hypothetical protein